jgi:hypothetical protein
MFGSGSDRPEHFQTPAGTPVGPGQYTQPVTDRGPSITGIVKDLSLTGVGLVALFLLAQALLPEAYRPGTLIGSFFGEQEAAATRAALPAQLEAKEENFRVDETHQANMNRIELERQAEAASIELEKQAISFRQDLDRQAEADMLALARQNAANHIESVHAAQAGKRVVSNFGDAICAGAAMLGDMDAARRACGIAEVARRAADAEYETMTKTRNQLTEEERQRVREQEIRRIAVERTRQHQAQSERWAETVGSNL